MGFNDTVKSDGWNNKTKHFSFKTGKEVEELYNEMADHPLQLVVASTVFQTKTTNPHGDNIPKYEGFIFYKLKGKTDVKI